MKKINGDNPGSFLHRLLYFYQCLSDHRKGINDSCDIFKPALSISNLNTFDKTIKTVSKKNKVREKDLISYFEKEVLSI